MRPRRQLIHQPQERRQLRRSLVRADVVHRLDDLRAALHQATQHRGGRIHTKLLGQLLRPVQMHDRGSIDVDLDRLSERGAGCGSVHITAQTWAHGTDTLRRESGRCRRHIRIPAAHLGHLHDRHAAARNRATGSRAYPDARPAGRGEPGSDLTKQGPHRVPVVESAEDLPAMPAHPLARVGVRRRRAPQGLRQIGRIARLGEVPRPALDNKLRQATRPCRDDRTRPSSVSLQRDPSERLDPRGHDHTHDRVVRQQTPHLGREPRQQADIQLLTRHPPGQPPLIRQEIHTLADRRQDDMRRPHPAIAEQARMLRHNSASTRSSKPFSGTARPIASQKPPRAAGGRSATPTTFGSTSTPLTPLRRSTTAEAGTPICSVRARTSTRRTDRPSASSTARRHSCCQRPLTASTRTGRTTRSTSTGKISARISISARLDHPAPLPHPENPSRTATATTLRSERAGGCRVSTVTTAKRNIPKAVGNDNYSQPSIPG